jgi:hypothetical protein
MILLSLCPCPTPPLPHVLSEARVVRSEAFTVIEVTEISDPQRCQLIKKSRSFRSWWRESLLILMNFYGWYLYMISITVIVQLLSDFSKNWGRSTEIVILFYLFIYLSSDKFRPGSGKSTLTFQVVVSSVMTPWLSSGWLQTLRRNILFPSLELECKVRSRLYCMCRLERRFRFAATRHVGLEAASSRPVGVVNGQWRRSVSDIYKIQEGGHSWIDEEGRLWWNGILNDWKESL